MAANDHLVIIGGKCRGANTTSQRGKQKKFRYNYIDSPHSISPETGFDVVGGLPSTERRRAMGCILSTDANAVH
jgi:hypothetical protein